MDGSPASVYARALRTWWWVVMAVPVVAVLAGVYLTSRQPRIYRAAATVAVMPSLEISDPSDVMRGLETLERRTIIATFASMAETREALDQATVNLGLESSEVSGYRIQASVLPSTNIIRIDVQGRGGERVSVLANELVAVLAKQARGMYRIFEMQPLEAARPARGPFHPDPTRNAVIAGILGLFSGLLMTLLLEAVRSHRVRHPRVTPVTLGSQAAVPKPAVLWSEASAPEEAVAASSNATRR